MAVFFFLLAIIAGVAVGDLVLENPAAGEVTVFDQTIRGYSQGWLLAMAATLGFVAALLLAASMGSRKARRARRKELRNARRDMQERMAGLEEENLSLWDKLADSEETGRRGSEPAGSTDPRLDRLPDQRHDPHRRVTPDPAERDPEPLYEQSRRAAGLDPPDRHDPGRDSRPPWPP